MHIEVWHVLGCDGWERRGVARTRVRAVCGGGEGKGLTSCEGACRVRGDMGIQGWHVRGCLFLAPVCPEDRG